MPRCYWSGANGQTAQKTVENPRLQFLDKVYMPVVIGLVPMARQRRKTVENPQLQFLDKVNMPVVLGLVPMGRHFRKLWRCRSFSF